MEYRKFGECYYIRMDRDDEIISTILEICKKENIRSATFSGIGGCKDAEIQTFMTTSFMQTLLECVKFTMKCAEQKLFEITGVDICGEADAENIHDNTANDYANQELIKIFTDRKGAD